MLSLLIIIASLQVTAFLSYMFEDACNNFDNVNCSHLSVKVLNGHEEMNWALKFKGNNLISLCISTHPVHGSNPSHKISRCHMDLDHHTVRCPQKLYSRVVFGSRDDGGWAEAIPPGLVFC